MHISILCGNNYVVTILDDICKDNVNFISENIYKYISTFMS
jgi:hypothetical protein